MATLSDARPCTSATVCAGLHVLLVEDDHDCALLMGRLLTKLGHEVRFAADGCSAVSEARSDPPDVILLDMCLPDMDGYEVASRVHASPEPKPPFIIALSGYACDEESRLAAGIDLYLTKPIESEELGRLLLRLSRVTKGFLSEV